jgi:hypothetical protein
VLDGKHDYQKRKRNNSKTDQALEPHLFNENYFFPKKYKPYIFFIGSFPEKTVEDKLVYVLQSSSEEFTVSLTLLMAVSYGDPGTHALVQRSQFPDNWLFRSRSFYTHLLSSIRFQFPDYWLLKSRSWDTNFPVPG